MSLECGLPLGVEGGVLGGLALGRDVAERAVQASIAIPVDPADGGVFDVGGVLVRSSWTTVAQTHSVSYRPITH